MPGLFERIRQKEGIGKLVELVIEDPSLIRTLVSTIETDKSTMRYNCEKILRLVSERRPELVYPYFDFFAKLLDAENNFIKWGAIITISNLAGVDSDRKFERISERYFAPISGPVMITAANIVGGSGRIALSKPYMADKIANEILKIEKARYFSKGKPSPECKNVICGHAIDTFETFIHLVKDKKPIVGFVKKQLKNRRPAVRKRAERFIKRMSCDK